MKLLFLFLFIFVFLKSQGQEWDTPIFTDSDWEIDEPYILNKKRRNILLLSEASTYSIALLGLNQLWYTDYSRSKFHFINDNKEWMQIDKIGHMSSSYYTGVVGIKAYKWAGFSRKKAIWYGGMTGSIFLSIIEILDGTTEEWGASSGDLLANTAGSFLAIFQSLQWNEQRIQLKFSYSPTKWANYNPDQLGSNHIERVIKDYNGQTYWLSFNIKSIFNIKNKSFPNWLSFSLGYGADFMIKPLPVNDTRNYRKRQYLASFDIDLNRIRTNSKVINSVLHTFGFLKFPAPTLQYRNGNIYLHAIYY